MTDPLVMVPCYITPTLLEKIRTATDAIAPGKRGKLTFSVDDTGAMTASLGTKVNVSEHAQITLGAIAQRDAAGGINWGATGAIEWEPQP